MASNAFEELKWRGLVYDHVEGVGELLTRGPVVIYNGFDATADSLHIGHLVPLLALARLQRFGHHTIALAGGGTSMIGDPSGKTSERQLLTLEEIEHNVDTIKGQLAHFLDFEVKSNPARVMNNANWLLKLNLVDFLRRIGKHFTVNYMIAKDSVRTRLEREDGISFTEFAYMLMQAYDYLHLHDTEGCDLQTGGSDQWGNITAGVELIRRMRSHAVMGMVYPLITKADGTKFGKTEEGSVWLSADRTSPYQLYQFWLNTDDRDVIPYLKVFTFLEKAAIQELETAVQEHPEERQAQRRLAREMVALLHGPTALARAEQASQVLFGGEISGLTASEVQDIFVSVPSSELPASQLDSNEFTIVHLLSSSGIATSKSDARRSIENKGIYLNNVRVDDPNQLITREDTIGEGKFLVPRKGRKNFYLVRIKE